MTGAYTAKPAVVADPPDVPTGWNPDWPFPGPYPPGYTPDVDCTIDISSSGGLTSGGLMAAKLQLKVYEEIDFEDVLIIWAIWSGTYYESSGNLFADLTVYIGELPEGSTWEVSVTGGSQIDLNVEISKIESDLKYVFDGQASGYFGNPTGIMTGRLFTESDQAAKEKTSTVVSSINWLEGVLHVELESLNHDGLEWISNWADGVGGWPST